jgi:methyl-accepting chemotaxis protein
MTGFFHSINARILLGYGAILVATLIAAGILTGNNHFVRTHLDSFVTQTLPNLDAVNALQARIQQLVLNGYSLYGLTLSGEAFVAARERLAPETAAGRLRLARL